MQEKWFLSKEAELYAWPLIFLYERLKKLENIGLDMLQYLSGCDILKKETNRRHTLCEAYRSIPARIRR